MWFEILPSGAVVYIAFTAGCWMVAGVHYLGFGRIYQRDLTEKFNQFTYMRNRRLTNNPYILQGLEVIPD